MRICLVDYPQFTGQSRRRALEAMGHEVIFFDHVSDRVLTGRIGTRLKRLIRPFIRTPEKLPGVTRIEMSMIGRDLLRLLKRHRPDFIILAKGSTVSTDTLREIRDRFGVPMVCYFGDSLYHPETREIARRLAPFMDVFFIADELEALQELPLACRRIHVGPHAVDPDVFHPVILHEAERSRYECDVAFVGGVYPPRLPVLRTLARMPIRLRIWGPFHSDDPNWRAREPEISRCIENRWIAVEEMPRIYAGARIVLNVHGLYGDGEGSRLWNLPQRPFEVGACRAFLLTDDCAQARRLFRVGDEIEVYDSLRSLEEKVNRFLPLPDARASMAEKAYRRTLREHTWRMRMQDVVTAMINHGIARPLAQENRPMIDDSGPSRRERG